MRIDHARQQSPFRQVNSFFLVQFADVRQSNDSAVRIAHERQPAFESFAGED
jgi:hypothetical protein